MPVDLDVQGHVIRAGRVRGPGLWARNTGAGREVVRRPIANSSPWPERVENTMRCLRCYMHMKRFQQVVDRCGNPCMHARTHPA